MAENKTDSWKDYEVGGLWENNGGETFYIQLDFDDGKGKVVLKAFRNQFKKEGSRQPDFRVYKDLPDTRKQPPKVRKPLEAENDNPFD